ncbi:GAF domain-containing protein [Photobacterium atrarenae]|uniref:GAF domain-containing protein n=1 Tax=Photobacterium atrarenae TaxID=865757 RepID=A0ABY5GE34_9GAMM|nr:GAF domain-containing protein [Photobacterium atrarenae]UTV27514.1 GAF domain-containing protein [Photobacterium atrarenae]
MEKKLIPYSAKNDLINASLVDRVVILSNVWMTLVAPIIVGVFVSFWFSLKDKEEVGLIVWCFLGAFLITHFCLALIQHQHSKKHLTHAEATELQDKYNELALKFNKLRMSHQDLTDLSISQITTLYLISAELDKAVGELNNELDKELENDPDNPPIPLQNSIEALLNSHLTNLLWPLVVNREDLFNYQEKSLYNIALYVYNDSSGKLEVKKRFNDERIATQNREWRPGIGHVGMTFLHKEIKCCPNIQSSTELTVKTEQDSKYYCSFISVPILACEDNEHTENEPHGVLVLTSASENQFHPRRDQIFLQAISKMLAVYLDKQEHALKMATLIASDKGSANQE